MTPTYTCIIVDDEPLAIRLLKVHLERVMELKLAQSFENPLEALSYLRNKPVDLVFLDIQMPVLTGMEFARSLQVMPSVIFTTAYRDYAVESYELQVVDYLVKPITFPRFYQAVDKFLQQSSPNPSVAAAPPPIPTEAGPQFRYFNVNKRHVKVAIADITHIESQKDYIKIFTHTQQLQTKERISDFIDTLPDFFLRVHRSFIVNLTQVTAFTAHDIEINGQEIPIGISYKRSVLERLKN